MAEGILRHKAEQQGLNLKIDSAGTESFHAGEHPDRRAISTATERGIDISKLLARQVRPGDFDEFDRILVADAQVYNELKDFTRSESNMKKVDFIMNLVKPNSNTGVPDPYYGGQEGFEKVFDMLERACDALLKDTKGYQ